MPLVHSSTSTPHAVVLAQKPLVHAWAPPHDRQPLASATHERTWPVVHWVSPTAHAWLQVPHAAAEAQNPLGHAAGALNARQPFESDAQVRS